jgi:hypothetical protein
MKAKVKTILFIAATIALFSFTFISSTVKETEKVAIEDANQNTPQGGFAIEDPNQWD